jgi:acetyl/propionyl-CoA carboxylase alpha subunit
LIEEAPSSCLTPDIRKAMGECAVNVAKACKYYGAGTVEFLVDDDLKFYFLEMNTRLQVEHCVTEMISGVDLVKEQIRVARGEKLSFTQEDLKINGHSIELRVCAEDPTDNFMPDTGRLNIYVRPQGPGIRVDDGYEQGMDIPIFYDPMIAKLVVWGKDRNEAIDRLCRAVDEFKIQGIQTTLAFGKWAVRQPAFVEGKFDTNFIGKYFKPEYLIHEDKEEAAIAAALAGVLWEKGKKAHQPSSTNGSISKWKMQRN